MVSLNTLIARDDSLDQDDTSLTPDMANTIIAIVAFIAVLCICFGAHFYYRRRRQTSLRPLLPTYNSCGHRRQLSISTNFDGPTKNSIYVYDEKRNLIANASSPVSGSVPEIRITFPEEENGLKNTRGERVVIVKVGDSGTVGMGPIREETLPPYPTPDSERFESLDMNRIGGLKDSKEEPHRWS